MSKTLFAHRCVQDLAWVIASPPIISGNINHTNWWKSNHCKHEHHRCLDTLTALDKNPAPLLTAIDQSKSHRLGHYFETLVAYWLTISPNYEVLLAGHPLRNANKTLGEIDFLLRERPTNKIIHLEVAVKFYLGTDELNNMNNWHGPGLHDRLDKKFNHLCNHQTQLTKKYPTLIPYTVDETACLIKGILFYPPKQTQSTDFTAENHLAGYWYQVPTHPEITMGCLPLSKKYWLADIPPTEQQVLLSAPQTTPEPQMHINYTDTNKTERFFILPSDFWDRPRP